MSKAKCNLTRRGFLACSGLAAAPLILPKAVWGADGATVPSERITLGCIGVGRMGMGDLKDFIDRDVVQVVAVCDLDSNRADYAKNAVEKYYARKKDSGYAGCATYKDYEDLLARDDIDAVSIVTPDHWHVMPAVAAAKAGKDIFLQKPLALTIAEGRILSDVVRANNRVFQCGSQQRSEKEFRHVCELVLNGRIGELQRIEVGFSPDETCGMPPDMPVPATLDYDKWLGQAPVKPYTETRVHPQKGYDRPGWLRIRDYGHGMITGWGAHHIDIAQWGMNMGLSGPIEIEGVGEYNDPATHLWDVHIGFDITYRYANGVTVRVSDKLEGGDRFIGTEGSVFVTRGKMSSDPVNLIDSEIPENGVHLYKSDDHKGNFLECIRTRKETVAPVEIAHRSCTACILGSIAMELKRKLRWNPETERFVDDAEADKMISRAQREPYVLKA